MKNKEDKVRKKYTWACTLLAMVYYLVWADPFFLLSVPMSIIFHNNF